MGTMRRSQVMGHLLPKINYDATATPKAQEEFSYLTFPVNFYYLHQEHIVLHKYMLDDYEQACTLAGKLSSYHSL